MGAIRKRCAHPPAIRNSSFASVKKRALQPHHRHSRSVRAPARRVPGSDLAVTSEQRRGTVVRRREATIGRLPSLSPSRILGLAAGGAAFLCLSCDSSGPPSCSGWPCFTHLKQDGPKRGHRGGGVSDCPFRRFLRAMFLTSPSTRETLLALLRKGRALTQDEMTERLSIDSTRQVRRHFNQLQEAGLSIEQRRRGCGRGA